MGVFEDMLGGDTEFQEPAISKAAREKLYGLGTKTGVKQPVQQIAPADYLQNIAYNQASQYANSAVPSAYGTAINAATNIATAPTDVMSVPGFKGIWDKILNEGTKSSRNLQRALKLTGNAATNSSRGRNAVGQLDTQVQEQLMGAALPLVQDIENRRYNATMALPGLANAEEAARIQRMSVGEQAGNLMRAIQQAVNSAQYEAELNDLNFRYGIQPRLLQSTMTNPVATTEPGWLTQTNQALEGLSDLGGNILSLTQGAGGMM